MFQSLFEYVFERPGRTKFRRRAGPCLDENQKGNESAPDSGIAI
jgi:hypothetical protein